MYRKFTARFIFATTLFLCHNTEAQLKVGNNKATISNNSYFEIESTSGSKIVVRKDSAMMGINNANPKNKLEITHGTSGNSGLRFTNMTNASSAISSSSVNQKFLSVNASGDVVLANSVDQLIAVTGLSSNLVSPVSAASFQTGIFENSYSKTDSTVLYLNQADGTTWVYTAANGGQYKSYVAPASTEWYLAGGTTDAGSNKTSTIYRTGNVGIGNSSPTNNLDVVGGISIRNVAGAAGTNYGMEINTSSNAPRIDWVANNAYIGQFASNNTDFLLKNSLSNLGNFRFSTAVGGSGVERMTILNNGNIGIGNAAPTYKLDVSGKGRFTDTLFGTKAQFSNLAIGASTDSVVTIDASGNLKKRSSSTYSNNWFVKSTTTPSSNNTDSIYQMGHVGIGINNPTYKLHVVGNARFAPNTGNDGTGEPVTVDIYGKVPTGVATQVGGIRLGWYGTYGGIEVLRGGSASGVGLGFNIANTTTGITSEGMRLSYNGNLSVGTISETGLLTLKVDSAALSTTNLDYTLKNSGTALARIQAIKYGTTNTGVLNFFTKANNGSFLERMRIDSNGYVGIGTTTPNAFVHINNTLPATATINADAQVLRLSRPVTSNIKWDNIAQFNLGSYATNVNANTRLDLAMNDGSNTTTSNVMTWQANGYVGIGTTAPIAPLHIQNSAATSLYIESTVADNNGMVILNANTASNWGTNWHEFIKFNNQGTLIGTIVNNGTTAVSYNTTSDERLKMNIRATKFGIDDLMRIQVKDYIYKADSAQKHQTGFIAQQLFKIIPNAVTVGGEDEKTNPWQVDYGKMTPYIVKAVQDQQDIIEKQKKNIEDLKDENNDLKDRVKDLEKQNKKFEKSMDALLEKLEQLDKKIR